MSGPDDRSLLVIVPVVVCCLLVAIGGVSGVGVGASGSEPGTGDPSGIDDPTAAQLSEGLLEEPSDTVSEPELAVFLSEPTVEAGTESTVEVTILNTGRIQEGSSLDEETATARGVELAVDDEDAPVDVSTGDTGVGSIPPGESVTVPVSVTAPSSADGDDGDLDIDVGYTYTAYDDDEAVDETETDDFEEEIEVGEASQFAIEDVETDAQVGTDGTVDVEIENVGESDAESARVTARSPTGGVNLGAAGDASGSSGDVGDGGNADGAGGAGGADDADDTGTADGDGAAADRRGEETEGEPSGGETVTETGGSAAFLGDLDDGDDGTVSFDTRLDSGLSVESYLLELQVVYEDEDGIVRESNTLVTAVEPTADQTFELGEVESTLAVGESGTVTAELENTGPEDVETPVVRAEPTSERIDFAESQVAVEDLEEDESTEIAFDADVSGEAEPGARGVTFSVEYGTDGDRRESDPFVRQLPVDAERSAFTITADDGEVPAGTTETVAVNVTNNQPETLSNVNVFLYADGPLSVDDDEAFIPELEPNESETVEIEVSAEEGAEQRAYPLEADLRYDDETDDDLISEVYQIPITVGEPPDDDGLLPSLFSPVPMVGLVVFVVGGAVVVRRRR
ncbi:MAG: hypothetical protein ACOC0Z_03060 [Halohasta sp.]